MHESSELPPPASQAPVKKGVPVFGMNLYLPERDNLVFLHADMDVIARSRKALALAVTI